MVCYFVFRKVLRWELLWLFGEFSVVIFLCFSLGCCFFVGRMLSGSGFCISGFRVARGEYF